MRISQNKKQKPGQPNGSTGKDTWCQTYCSLISTCLLCLPVLTMHQGNKKTKRKQLFDKNYRNSKINCFTWQNYYDLLIFLMKTGHLPRRPGLSRTWFVAGDDLQLLIFLTPLLNCLQVWNPIPNTKLIIFKMLIHLVCMMCIWRRKAHEPGHIWGQRTALWSHFSPSPCGFWDWTRVVRLGNRDFYPLRHFTSP